jgi:hypothetical protein
MPAEKAVYKLAVRSAVRTFATGAVVMGALVAWGGPGRFAVPALETARLVPGGAYTWAGLIAAGGLVCWAGIAMHWCRLVVCTGLALQFLWFLFFDVSLWLTAFADPATPVTGPVVYALLAVVCLILYSAGHQLHALDVTTDPAADSTADSTANHETGRGPG